MKRFLTSATIAAVFLAIGPAYGETLLERGTYLVRGVVACGNCHTTRGEDGQFVMRSQWQLVF